MAEFRVADAVQLAQINVHSVINNYNRQLSEGTILNLDLEGVNVLQAIMIHEHADFEKVEPHMRVHAFIKVRSQVDPFQQIIDVSMEDWNNLVPLDW
jgi:hypothetical protein